jgi:catechol 2,3-dioxygenase-like lactoylglutathione lyase family enzyme
MVSPISEEIAMIGTKNAMATVAVRNLAAAKRFYEETLGLQRAAGTPPEPAVYQAGKFRLLVYESKFAGTNQASAVSWDAGEDIEKIVDALKAKGVRFERYDDLPGLTRKGDLHVTEGFKAAWFKDPDGNIHALAGR